MLREIQDEAARLDRSLSWVVQRAWKHARAAVAALPGVDQPQPRGGDKPKEIAAAITGDEIPDQYERALIACAAIARRHGVKS